MTILAIGGGGFDSEQPHRSALDRYILTLTPQQNPKVCLIPTASGDSLFRIARFHKAAEQLACQPTTCELFRPPSRDLTDYLLTQDILYISGGSTYNMLVLWREWGLDKILHQAWQQGIPITGTSAGANAWFQRCSTDSFHGELSAMECLGWLPYDFCPHYNEEPERKPTLQKLIKSGNLSRTLACDGGAACLFTGTELTQVITTSPTASAYWLDEQGNETLTNPQLLTI